LDGGGKSASYGFGVAMDADFAMAPMAALPRFAEGAGNWPQINSVWWGGGPVCWWVDRFINP
jgi:hypothetical protein